MAKTFFLMVDRVSHLGSVWTRSNRNLFRCFLFSFIVIGYPVVFGAGFALPASPSGSGVNLSDPTTIAVTTTPIIAANIGQPITVTCLVTDTQIGRSSAVPNGSVSFTDTVGAILTPLNNGIPVVLTAGTATLSGVALRTAGVHTITANFVGTSGAFAASSNNTTLGLAKTPVVVATSASQPIQITNGQSGSIPIIVSGPYTSFASPTGTISYNVLNSSQASVDSGILPLTAGTSNSTAAVPLASTLPSGVYTVSLGYAGDTNYAVSSTPSTILVNVNGETHEN